MANVNNLHGFRPLMRSISGGPGAAALGCHKLVGDGVALFINDVVKKAASGVRASQCITAATAGAANYGVNLIYGALSTLTDHVVIPGIHQVFETQIDTIALTTLGQNALLVAGAGSTTTKLSGHSINSIATTNTHDFHVLGLWRSPDNAVGAYARVEVTFNIDQLGRQVAGV